MRVGGREEEQQRHAGAATQQRVGAIATQQRAEMVVRSMPDGGIGVRASPGQDRCTIDDEVPRAQEPLAEGQPDDHDEQCLAHGCPRSGATFPLL